MLTQENIDKLFNVVVPTTLPPVTEMKPSEIDELEGYDRLDYKIHFYKSLRIYVKPLEKLVKNMLDRANKEKYSYDIEDLSIFERVKVYNNILIRSGYTKEQIGSLLPKNEEEVDVLSLAFENGFKDICVLDNETRVLKAKNYLQSLGKNISTEKRKSYV